MYDENDIKIRILNKAEEMFTLHGYSKITMEEIAGGLGMSKKTIYKYFSSKESLVREIIENMRCDVEDKLNKIWTDGSLDFVGKLKKIMDFLSKQSKKFRSPLIEDLHRSMPEIWAEVNEFRRTHALEKVSVLLKEGVESGAFRKDIDQQLILLMYINSMQGILNPEVLSQLPYTANQALEIIVKVLFEGIFTEEGREKYMSYQKEDSDLKE